MVSNYTAKLNRSFPHAVSVCTDMTSVMRLDRIIWLTTHVGNRDHGWCFPDEGQFRFKSQDDAIKFALVWS